MVESEEKFKSLLMRVKEESEKAGLKLSIKKNLGSWHLVPSVQFSSVALSCPTLCDPMNRPPHARPPCPLPIPGVHPNPCPWSQ